VKSLRITASAPRDSFGLNWRGWRGTFSNFAINASRKKDFLIFNSSERHGVWQKD
jgi:hypothetical protein